MKTHTIRNKASQRPILTLAPKFFEKALQCHPEAFCLALHWFHTGHRQLTGVATHLDYEQSQTFNARVGANSSGAWHSRFAKLDPVAFKMVSVFTAGFTQITGLDFEKALELAQEFYSMVDHVYLGAPKPGSAP